MALCCLLALLPGLARADQLTVFAAASLKTALDRIADEFEQSTDKSVAISYAGTSVLARQISLGAPADIFVAASSDWMDWLEDQQAIDATRRFDLVGNRLVLIAHGAQQTPVALTPQDLKARLGQDRIAMALVEAVPAGIYGKAALLHLGVWDHLVPQIAQTDNARTALALVASGEAPYGIVYATDAQADPRVSVIASFSSDSHAPILYPAALVTDRASPAAVGFLDHLRGDAARRVFEDQGFTILSPPS